MEIIELKHQSDFICHKIDDPAVLWNPNYRGGKFISFHKNGDDCIAIYVIKDGFKAWFHHGEHIINLLLLIQRVIDIGIKMENFMMKIKEIIDLGEDWDETSFNFYRHRDDDQPSYIQNDGRCLTWWKFGDLHRENGPAVVNANTQEVDYYLNGEKIYPKDEDNSL